jgi:hypothetical protein
MVLKEEFTKLIDWFKIWWIWELSTAQSWLKIWTLNISNFCHFIIKKLKWKYYSNGDPVYAQFVDDIMFTFIMLLNV